jgi:hypothetical protein
MTGVAGFFLDLAIRLVLFTGVFWGAALKDLIKIDKKWARPLVALVFAVLDTALYRLLGSLFDMTIGAFVMPLVVNLVLLMVTVKVFETKKWIETDGLFSTVWVALLLTAAHGLLHVVFTYV